MKQISEKISREFEKRIEEIFGENLVFGFIFGGFAKGYATKKHDVDMFICLEERNPKQEKLFSDFYYDLHRKYKLKPDFNDPGELTTRSELDSVIEFLNDYKIRRVVRTFSEYEAIVWGDILSGKVSAVVGDDKVLAHYQSKCSDYPRVWRNQLLALVDQDTLEKENRLKKGELLEALNTTRLFRRIVTYLKRPQKFEEVSGKSDNLHICILGGGGNVAEAVAANLVAKGHRVSQFRFDNPISIDGVPTRPRRSQQRLKKTSYLNVSGQDCDLQEHDINWIGKEDFDDVDVFMVGYPSFMSEKLAEYVGSSMANRPVINLSDRFLGSYAFCRKLEELFGTDALPSYTVGFNGVPIMALKANREAPTSVYYVKPKHSVACYPVTREYEAYKLVSSIFHFGEDALVKYSSPLHLAFENAHCIEHAIVDLYNLKKNKYNEGGDEKLYSKDLYDEFVVAEISGIIEERDKISNALLNRSFYSLADYDRIVFGGGEKSELGTSDFRVKHPSLSKAPSLMKTTAFGYEDIGWSIVPMESLAKLFGVETPLISNLIDQWNSFMNCDYRECGRTVQSLNVASNVKTNVTSSVQELNWGENFFPLPVEKPVLPKLFTSDKRSDAQADGVGEAVEHTHAAQKSPLC